MNKLNLTLVIAVVVLFALSLFSYNRSISRAERFERGQKFLSQLNADNIHEIEITKGEEKVQLRKADEKFEVASMHNYPAKNESINRFINDAIGISLEKNVGSGETLEKELEIQGGEKTTTIVFRNDAGKEMVTFAVGKSSDDGRGSYVKRIGGGDDSIYLTSKGVYLSSNEDSFLDKDLLDVKEAEIESIQGADFVIEKQDGELALKGVPKGKQESSDVSQVKGLLDGLRYDKVYLADDATVAGLNFNNRVLVKLSDSSSYEAQVAVKDDKYYLTISGKMDRQKLMESAQISKDESEDQLKAKSEMLTRNDEIEAFNQFHGSWVYLLTEYQAKKFLKKKADLIEDEEKDDEE